MAKYDEQLKLAQSAQGTQQAAPAAQSSGSNSPSPALYGNAYDQQITDAYNAVLNQQPFSYSINGDALYDNYRSLYTQNAKRAMKDTFGQAAANTGGYGSSYAQGVAQQRYDETMRGLTEMIPELEERAYNRWLGERDRNTQNFQMAAQMGQMAKNTQDEIRSKLEQQILSTGYVPTQEELDEAGMTYKEFQYYRTAWVTGNPDVAYANGDIDADTYYKLTGKQARGAAASGGGGGGYYYGGGGGGDDTDTSDQDYFRKTVQAMVDAGEPQSAINAWMREKHDEYGVSVQDIKDIRAGYGWRFISGDYFEKDHTPVRTTTALK